MKIKLIQKKIFIALLFIITPFVLEFLISNWNISFQYADDKGVKHIPTEKLNREVVNKEERYVKYEITEIDSYINKLKITLPPNVGKFELILDTYNEFDTSSNEGREVLLIDDVNTTNQYIGKKVENITIKSSNMEFKIEKLSIQNTADFNVYRFMCFAFVSLFIFLILYFRNSMKFSLEKVFVVLIALVGILSISAYPKVSHWSPDSQIHFRMAYNQSFSKTNVSLINSYDLASKLPEISKPNTFEDNNQINTILNDKKNNEVIGNVQKRIIVPFNAWGYFPSSTAFKAARMLDLPFTIQFVGGKLFNLIFYLVLGYFAISYANKGKRLFFVLATLPAPIFFATQYSVDGIIYSCILLGTSLFIGQYLKKDEKVSFKWTVGFLFTICFASFCKAVYAPLILLPLLFNKEKFSTNKQRKVFKVGIIAIFVLLFASMILPIISNSGAPGDMRGGVTSASGQILSMILHPFASLDLFSNILIDSIATDLLAYKTTSFFYYMGDLREVYSFIILSLMLYLAFTDWQLKEKIQVKHKLFMVFILLLIVGMIYGALYLSFTPIGLSTVNGIQARYFTPLLALLLFLPSSFSVKNQLNDKKLSINVIMIMAFISYVSVYSMIVLVFNN